MCQRAKVRLEAEVRSLEVPNSTNFQWRQAALLKAPLDSWLFKNQQAPIDVTNLP